MEILFYVGLYLMGIMAGLYIIPRSGFINDEEGLVVLAAVIWPLTIAMVLVFLVGYFPGCFLIGVAQYFINAGQAHRDRSLEKKRRAVGW